MFLEFIKSCFKKKRLPGLQSDKQLGWKNKTLKLFDPFSWMGFNCLKARGSSLLFTTKFPEIPGTRFIDLGRMEGTLDLRM